MRLYNIYYVCKMVMEDLNSIEIRDYLLENGDGKKRIKRLTNLPRYRIALEKLKDVEIFKNDVQQAMASVAYYGFNVSTAIIDENDNRIISLANKIKNNVKLIVDLYESMKITKHQIGLDVYVPPCKYLKDYMSILKDIDFIINQCPYLQSDEEEFQYNGTDIGSDWITLVVVTTGVITTTSCILLNNFAELTKKIQEIRVRFQMIDQNEEVLKTMKIRNELLMEMQQVYAKEKEDAFNNAVIDLKESLGGLNDGEEEGKVLVSLKKYNSLLESGVRFYSSIESPPEIKELLPSSDDPKALSDTIIKYLEDTNKNGDKKL